MPRARRGPAPTIRTTDRAPIRRTTSKRFPTRRRGSSRCIVSPTGRTRCSAMTTCRRRACGSYRERGLASWYGRKFHAQKTAIGEPYDMYAMTAAHPTLPLPSYARVTNLANGKSVVVRVNDRGPFHPGRIIDLSYAAAYRLGIAQKGSGEVEVESILPGAAPPQLAGPLPPVAASETPPALALPIGQEAGRLCHSARRVRQLCECAGICRPAGEPNRESRRRTKSPAGRWAVSRLCRTLFDQGGGTPGRRPAARCIGARLDGAHRTAGAVTR